MKHEKFHGEAAPKKIPLWDAKEQRERKDNLFQSPFASPCLFAPLR
jgi:hypothetical protein